MNSYKQKKLEEFDENLRNRNFYWCEDIDTDKIKQFIANLIDETENQAQSEMREDLERLQKVINLYGEPRCEYLHHKKAHQHKISEDCPVEKEIISLINLNKTK